MTMLTSLTLLAFVPLSRAACELDIWVFDSLDHCTEPDAADKIIPDGECRSVGLNSPYTFPGYYRATCNGNGVEFLVSGCSDSTCQQCRKDPRVGETLYTTSNGPIPIGLPLWEPAIGKSYRCYSLTGRLGVSIYFAFHGTCDCPAGASLPGSQGSFNPPVPAASASIAGPTANVASASITGLSGPAPRPSTPTIPVSYFTPTIWTPTVWTPTASDTASASITGPTNSQAPAPTTGRPRPTVPGPTAQVLILIQPKPAPAPEPVYYTPNTASASIAGLPGPTNGQASAPVTGPTAQVLILMNPKPAPAPEPVQSWSHRVGETTSSFISLEAVTSSSFNGNHSTGWSACCFGVTAVVFLVLGM